MKIALALCGIFILALLAMPLAMVARAEWKSEPPEIMVGGEVIGQFYHLFSNAQAPHRVWVKYKDQIYFCRGKSKMFQCQESNENGRRPTEATLPDDGADLPTP